MRLVFSLSIAVLASVPAAVAQAGDGAQKKFAVNPPVSWDLSTPGTRVPPVPHTTRAPAAEHPGPVKSGGFGTVDLGGGQLRFDGSRSGRDLSQEVTGFDQTPGSDTFRRLGPAGKTGTPPYVGFTLTAPN